DALAHAGFQQTSFQASLVGEVTETPPSAVVIRSVETSEIMEQFLDVYLLGWGFPLAIYEGAKANMRGWLGLPGWHLYLALLWQNHVECRAIGVRQCGHLKGGERARAATMAFRTAGSVG